MEVDSSYYALPSRANAERWLERTPARFTFDVKAFAPLTQHPGEPARLPAGLRAALPAEKPRLCPRDLPDDVLASICDRFAHAIAPLAAGGRERVQT